MLGRLKDYLLRAKIMFSRELPILPNTVSVLPSASVHEEWRHSRNESLVLLNCLELTFVSQSNARQTSTYSPELGLVEYMRWRGVSEDL
jgi:hypothetical protein